LQVPVLFCKQQTKTQSTAVLPHISRRKVQPKNLLILSTKATAITKR
jgi:hypothetical protein